MNDEITPESAYQKGIECLRTDPKRAVKCLKKASDLGHVPAMRDLGLMYLQGNGVEKDHGKAYSYISTASKEMDPESIYILATMYEKGMGVERDLYESLKLFAFSANMNHIGADMDADRVDAQISAERREKLRSRPILNLEISDVDVEAACCKKLYDEVLAETMYVVDTYQGPELVGEDEKGFEVIHEKCPFCNKNVKKIARNKKY